MRARATKSHARFALQIIPSAARAAVPVLGAALLWSNQCAISAHPFVGNAGCDQYSARVAVGKFQDCLWDSEDCSIKISKTQVRCLRWLLDHFHVLGGYKPGLRVKMQQRPIVLAAWRGRGSVRQHEP